MRRLGKHVATMLGLGLLACTLLGSGDDGGCGVPAGGELCTSTGGTWDYMSSDNRWKSQTCGGDAIDMTTVAGRPLLCACPASAPYWTDGIGCNGSCAGKCVGKPVDCLVYKMGPNLASDSAACLRHKGCSDNSTMITAGCGGIAAPCQYFGRKESCTRQTGCAWEDSSAWMSAEKDSSGACVGTPRPCSLFPLDDNNAETLGICARQQGCYPTEAIWPTQAQSLCKGTPELCSGFGWKSTCEQQAGCTWKSVSATP